MTFRRRNPTDDLEKRRVPARQFARDITPRSSDQNERAAGIFIRLHALVIEQVARFSLGRLHISLQTGLHHTNMTFRSRICWLRV